MDNKIVVIGVYFGKLPNYCNLWLKSCECNPTIDFIIFNDEEIADLPANVKRYAMTLDEIQKRATSILGFEACLSRPYKCCDYKAMFGLLFEEYISGYDYWGHCDFDVIFGDLQGYFERYDLYRYDRFLALGHLSLYRNTKEVNERYKLSANSGGRDYRTVYSSNTSFAFDELSGMTKVYQDNNLPIFVKNVFADIASVYHRYRLIEVYSLDRKPKNYKKQVFYWEKGHVYRAFVDKKDVCTDEFMYIHFKKRPDYQVEFDVAAASGFYITNEGFVEKAAAIEAAMISKLNPFPGIIHEQWELAVFKIKGIAVKAKRFLRKVFKTNGTA